MYAVIAATGKLGHLAVESLIDKGIEPPHIAALVRDTAKAADLADRGVVVRHFDMDDAATLAPALEGVDSVLFISSPTVGVRERQHGDTVKAAQEAGVRRLVYVSFIGAQDHPENPLTPEHKFTEDLLADAGIPEVVVLRNAYYHENLLGQLDQILESGVLVGASGGGVINAAARADLAEAAALALIGAAAPKAVAPGAYDLVGQPLTKADMATQIAEGSGKPVAYRNVTLEEYRQGMVDAGMPPQRAGFYAEVEKATASGALASDSTDLATILGREPQTLADTVRVILER